MLNTFESSLVQWGDAFVIRIPDAIVTAAHLKRDERIVCTIENGNVIMKPVRQRYTLDELLDGTTELEPEVDWGKPVGEETW